MAIGCLRLYDLGCRKRLSWTSGDAGFIAVHKGLVEGKKPLEKLVYPTGDREQ